MFKNDVKCKITNINNGLQTMTIQKYNSYCNFPYIPDISETNKIYLTIKDKFSDKVEIISYTSAILSGQNLTLGDVTRGEQTTTNYNDWNLDNCYIIQAVTAEHINNTIPSFNYKKIPFIVKNLDISDSLNYPLTNIGTINEDTIWEVTTKLKYTINSDPTVIHSRIKMIVMYDSSTMSYDFNQLECQNADGTIQVYIESNGDVNIKIDNTNLDTYHFVTIFGLVEVIGV